MDPPPQVEVQPEVTPTAIPSTAPTTAPVLVPTLPIVKTELNTEDERNTGNSSNPSALDGSEEMTPSPTTGDEQRLNPWLTVKCIFCNTLLTASEEPKLLECLHAACGNCITAKISENISAESGKF